MSNTRATLSSRASPSSSCQKLLRSLLVSSRQQLPFSSLLPKRALIFRYRQSFHRVQSPRNLAHSCRPRVGQWSPPAVARFLPLMDHPGCHLDPRSSPYWVLLGFALLLLGLVSEASEAPSGTAHEEHSLMIVPLLLPLPVVLIAPCIPASRVISLLTASFCNPQTVSSTNPYFSSLSKVFFIRYSSSFFSLLFFFVSFVWTSASTIARFSGTAALSCELEEAASLLIS